MDQSLTFDRTSDISKLEGCKTRGVSYRWSIFERHLATLSVKTAALDFGAGSLRESYDLANRGFAVTSVDLDADVLDAYKAKYAWSHSSHEVIAVPDLLDAFSRLNGREFSLITCFDVLEHLENPKCALEMIARHVDENGLIFVTVPNGRSLFELAWRLDLKLARMTGRHIRPGEPHLQRNSPQRWKRIIRDAGLSIIDHEMHIGFFANTAAALIQVPLALSGRVLRNLGVRVDAIGVAKRIIDKIGPTMNFIDQRTRFLCGLYGWNLFVLSR